MSSSELDTIKVSVLVSPVYYNSCPA